TQLMLKQGQSKTVRVTARVVAPSAVRVAAGSLVVAPDGGRAIRVPWAVSLAPSRVPLLSGVRLSRASFAASDGNPAVLSFRAGSLSRHGGLPEIQPVARVELRLIRGDGRWLGVIGRLRDVLPGRFAFGITGRDPEGTRLPAGSYRLQVVAWPILPGKPVRITLPFAIE